MATSAPCSRKLYNVIPIGPINRLGEGPHWDKDTGVLYYVDLFGCAIHKYNPSTGVDTSADMDGRTTFIIPVKGERNKFVVAVERELIQLKWDGKNSPCMKEKILEVDEEEEYKVNRFNDGKCDLKNRLWAGTMGPETSPGQFVEENGFLYSFATRRNVTRQLDKISISNGLDWSIDGKTMYYIDTLKFTLDAMDYNDCCPEVKNRRVIFDFKANNVEGYPDGMALDKNGNIWVALFGGSAVVCINPNNGRILKRVEIPAPHVTSVAFGGDDLSDLYVTTAWHNMDDEQREKYPLAGSNFVVKGLGVSGFPGRPIEI